MERKRKRKRKKTVGELHDYSEKMGIRVNDQGLTAVVEMAGENTVVLTTLRHPPFSLGQLQPSLGLPAPSPMRSSDRQGGGRLQGGVRTDRGSDHRGRHANLIDRREPRAVHLHKDPTANSAARSRTRGGGWMAMSVPAPIYVAAVQMDSEARPGPSTVWLRDCSALSARRSDKGAAWSCFLECALTGLWLRKPSRKRWSTPSRSQGPSTKLFADDCAWLKTHVIFGLLERDGDRLYNACVLVGPGGVIGSYRKVHLPYLGVDRFTDPGDRPFAVHEVKGIRVGMHICYDGSFSEVGRVLTLLGADLPRVLRQTGPHIPSAPPNI